MRPKLPRQVDHLLHGDRIHTAYGAVESDAAELLYAGDKAVNQERDAGGREEMVLENHGSHAFHLRHPGERDGVNRARNRLGIDMGVNVDHALQGLREREPGAQEKQA